ncbi:MAG: hypothetical protein ACK5XT_18050 [Gemmatimonas sp.]|jgi:hypothetical protein|uniref:hypothetical protein n=1 Tax=Gemmatimonas sp. TaxID=1962908 RepID=UPI00391F1B37|nr:hypothetical protein [Gemmatimonadota bacterium]
MNRMALLAAIIGTVLQSACSAEPARTPAALRLDGSPASLGVALRSEGAEQRGYAAADSAPRIIVRAADGQDDDARLCSVVASRTRVPVALAWGFPVDSALPRLATRVLVEGDVQGVRFVLPGAESRYVFEGLTRDGVWRVSVRWPVTSDSAQAVPVGAPDSLIERALTPSPLVLDSLVAALRLTEERTVTATRPRAAMVPRAARAVPVLSDLPVHEVSPTAACPEATVALSALARVDQMVRIPVRAGDVISADAIVENGTVRLAFDEALPRPESRERQSEPHAAIAATVDGRVTLRIRVQVLPRAQAERQTVLLRLVRAGGGSPAVIHSRDGASAKARASQRRTAPADPARRGSAPAVTLRPSIRMAAP